MPTPFSHLLFAQRLLDVRDCIDARFIPALQEELSAFLLGTIAADARVSTQMPRENTHFYVFGQPMVESPWRSMLHSYPELQAPQSPSQRAFVAGYIGHLAMDEVWSLKMVGPHFFLADWGSRDARFLMLHIILSYMDERDYELLEFWQAEALAQAAPASWVPFISDEDLAVWQHLIQNQLRPNGTSQTLEIFGQRVIRKPAELRAILDDPRQMQRQLWENVPQATLAEIEADMYSYACASMEEYLIASS
jgi:hypothetical protein